MEKKVLFVAPAKLYPVDAEGKPVQQVRENVSIPALTVLGSLKSAGFEVDFMDLAADGYGNHAQYSRNTHRFGLPDEAVVERIRDTHPMALLVTSMFSTEQSMVDDLTSLVKKSHPILPIIAGGIHATLDAKSTLGSGNIDFVVAGEAEQAIQGLLMDIAKDGAASVKETRGQIVNGAIQPDLDLPWAFEKILLRDRDYRYNDNASRRGRIYSHLTSPEWTRNFALYYSRGCPMHCDYCASTAKNGNTIRHMGSERMFDDLKILHESYDVQIFYNQADTFGFHPEDIEFLKKVRDYRGEHPDFAINNPNAFFARLFFPPSMDYELDEGLLDLLKDSGFNVITVAVETFNQRFNKKIDLGKITPGKISDLFAAVHSRGMKTELYMMYAFPGQTVQELRYDEKIVSSLAHIDDVAWQGCMIFPGTAYYTQGLDRGWFTEESYRCALKDGYFFHHMPKSLNFSLIPHDEIEAFRKQHIPDI